MSTIKDGGPAFPILDDCGHGLALRHSGMDLRDWFAGQALAGLGDWTPDNYDLSLADSDTPDLRRQRAKWCYAMADALLAARENQP